MRLLGLAALAFGGAGTTCTTLKAFAVAPAPERRLDGAAKVAFALVERVTARRGLTPHDPGEAVRAGRELTCFANRRVRVCGEVISPEIQFTITPGSTPWADSVRTEVLDSLRAEFGTFQVLECKWDRWRGRCPPIAPRDST